MIQRRWWFLHLNRSGVRPRNGLSDTNLPKVLVSIVVSYTTPSRGPSDVVQSVQTHGSGRGSGGRATHIVLVSPIDSG